MTLAFGCCACVWCWPDWLSAGEIAAVLNGLRLRFFGVPVRVPTSPRLPYPPLPAVPPPEHNFLPPPPGSSHASGPFKTRVCPRKPSSSARSPYPFTLSSKEIGWDEKARTRNVFGPRFLLAATFSPRPASASRRRVFLRAGRRLQSPSGAIPHGRSSRHAGRAAGSHCHQLPCFSDRRSGHWLCRRPYTRSFAPFWACKRRSKRSICNAQIEADKIRKEAELKAKDDLYQKREELNREIEQICAPNCGNRKPASTSAKIVSKNRIRRSKRRPKAWRTPVPQTQGTAGRDRQNAGGSRRAGQAAVAKLHEIAGLNREQAERVCCCNASTMNWPTWSPPASRSTRTICDWAAKRKHAV